MAVPGSREQRVFLRPGEKPGPGEEVPGQRAGGALDASTWLVLGVSVLAPGALEAPVFPAFLSVGAEEPDPCETCPGCVWQSIPVSSSARRGRKGSHLGITSSSSAPCSSFLTLTRRAKASDTSVDMREAGWSPGCRCCCRAGPAREQKPISGTRRMRARSPTGLTWVPASPFRRRGWSIPALPATGGGAAPPGSPRPAQPRRRRWEHGHGAPRTPEQDEDDAKAGFVAPLLGSAAVVAGESLGAEERRVWWVGLGQSGAAFLVFWWVFFGWW